ncbi:PTS system, fructose-specific IIC component [Amphibacillus marinus]|uniref:PTS system, fructose-specific IIC component n=1 Tax=Amphibacillus marinus TaxID=872970 RepID=A0A1H8L9S2_9BACI|nr:PTS fructose transporter subunit IIC [Amphibacillus marinus]SEO01867.1 PTS system, fructose-specific IIC component [Amphibacillus marinus]
MKKILSTARGHLMTGISWSIPMIIGAGMLVGIPSIIGLMFGVTSWGEFAGTGTIWQFLELIRNVGWAGIGLFNVVLAGFIAYSIADKPAIGAGFIAGYFANQRGTGFLGAVVLAFVAGYAAKYLIKKMNFNNQYLQQIKGVVFIPLLTVTAVGIVAAIVDTPLVNLNLGLVNWIRMMSESGTNSLLLAVIIGAMIAADLGGPINKAAFTAVTALIAEGIFTPAVFMRVAICAIPLGYALAVFIKKDKFSNDLQGQGIGAFVMSLVGITEGAIPFVLANPLKLTIINIIGGSVGAGLAALLGAATEIPMFGGVYGFLAVTQNSWAYLVGVLAGALIVCAGALAFGDFNVKKLDESADADEIVFEEL